MIGNLERIGDHASNMAESLIYTVIDLNTRYNGETVELFCKNIKTRLLICTLFRL